MNSRAYVPADTAWYLISLRPSGQHDGLRRAAARHGARTVALSPWRLQPRDDASTRDQLRQARFHSRHLEHRVFDAVTRRVANGALHRLRHDLQPDHPSRARRHA